MNSSRLHHFLISVLWHTYFICVICSQYVHAPVVPSHNSWKLSKMHSLVSFWCILQCCGAPIKIPLSICIHITTLEWLNRFSWKFILGSFTKICHCISVLVVSWTTIFSTLHKVYMCFCAWKWLRGYLHPEYSHIGNLPAIQKCQSSSTGKCTRIVMLCVHYLTSWIY
jgi:hypothetical protein